jgi:hypothetical protein
MTLFGLLFVFQVWAPGPWKFAMRAWTAAVLRARSGGDLLPEPLRRGNSVDAAGMQPLAAALCRLPFLERLSLG